MRRPDQTADPERYEANQKLRALERKVRAAKRVEMAAMTPEAKKEARKRVRAWEARIRDHVKDTGILRARDREQVRVGDARAADGRLRASLSPLPDGTPFPRELQTGARRMSRKDLDDRLRLARASGDTRAADALRREQIRRMRVGPLGDAVQAAIAEEDWDEVDLLSAELDRRDQANARARDRRLARRTEREEARAREFERLLAGGEDPEVADAVAAGTTVERQRRTAAIAALRADGYSGRGFDQLTSAAFRDEVYRRVIAAEDATRGHMLTQAARAAGVDPASLFVGSEARARKLASPELREWWDQHGRPTLAEYRADLLGDPSARRFRAHRGDFLT